MHQSMPHALPSPRLLALLLPLSILPSLTQAAPASSTDSQIDSLFNWAESAYPQVLTPAAKSMQIDGYTARCYASNTLCLGVKDGQLFLYQNGKLDSVGSLSSWLATADQEKVENARVFPRDLALSAPTRQSSDAAKASVRGTFFPMVVTPAVSLSYASATSRINALLSGSRALSAGFDGSAFLGQASNASCFGPQLAYSGHPDAGSTSGSGSLPSGDLGLWLETDSSTGDACAAAQLNARMDGASGRANAALMAVASMLRAAVTSGAGLPAPGSSNNVLTAMNALGVASTTFTTASIALDSSGKTWTYQLDYTFTDSSRANHNVAVKLVHTPGSTTTTYDGLLTQSFTTTFPGGNCGSGSNPVTRIDTLKYSRSGSSAMSSVQRSGQFCGTGSYSTLGTFDSSGQLSPAAAWKDDFARFGAQYDPTTLKGYYLYAWQAGNGDSNSRLLQLGLNGPSGSVHNDGEAYYGYGDPIASSDGKVKGFYCAWAAPKPARPVGLHAEYAQRQFLRLDSSGKWSTPTGGANIRYAPTDSCTYSGSGSFWYDRNLNGGTDESAADLTVSTPDLMGLGSATTIGDAISARGYVQPAF